MPSSRPVNIEETIDSPKIILDAEKATFLIDGPSYPEDAFDIYDRVLGWVKQADYQLNGELVCDFKYKVLSSASRKLVYEVLLELEKLHAVNSGILINWYYEKFDEDMKEVGEDFSEIINIPFKLLPV